MKIDRLNDLIAHLETIPTEAFNMADWFRTRSLESVYFEEGVCYFMEHLNDFKKILIDSNHWCGTSGCIAGHAMILAQTRGEAVEDYHAPSKVAQEWLGLTNNQALMLFNPNRFKFEFNMEPPEYDWIIYSKVTNAEAVEVLKSLRDDSWPNWEPIALKHKDLPRND